MTSIRYFNPERTWFLAAAVAGLIIGAVVVSTFLREAQSPAFCGSVAVAAHGSVDPNTTELQLNTILHYATSRITPQQSVQEITVSFEVLRSAAPCNFLIFGLGYDSLMWASFNPGGTTLFLEEDPKWFQQVLKESPNLRAHTVRYRTKLSESDDLIAAYHKDPICSPSKAFLRGNSRCRLALDNLPEEVYDKEWDLIMIDAPKGYFPEGPGRMAAIYSAAVMARNRKRPGVTHVFLHDVDRPVEKTYAELFLCRKYLKKSVGRLFHFEIPPASNSSDANSSYFC